MKVKELKELLNEFDNELEIILQKDSEGNGYSPLSGADNNSVYIADSTWSGDVYSANWSADDACMDDDEWEELLKRPRCVVLWPVN
jgi:hypothetical protein